MTVPVLSPLQALVFSTVEADLSLRSSGRFDITGLSGLTPGKPVFVQQAAAAYTGKGTLTDEAEMEPITATGYVVDASTIRVYWSTVENSPPVMGNVKFNYLVGA